MSKDNFRMSGSIQPTPHYAYQLTQYTTQHQRVGGQNYLLTYLKQAKLLT